MSNLAFAMPTGNHATLVQFPKIKVKSGIKGRNLGGASALKSREDLEKLKNFFLNYDNGTARYSPNYRNFALVVFATNCGRRAGDILKLKIGDVMFINSKGELEFHKQLYISEQKTSKTSHIYLNGAMKDALDLYFTKDEVRNRTVFNLEQPLFMSRQKDKNGKPKSISLRVYNYALTLAKEKCGFEGRISSHTCRKTFGRLIFESESKNGNGNMSLAVLQKLFRHSSSETTLTYLNITEDEQNKLFEKYQF